MIIFKIDRKTGKKYRIVVPDWDVPIPVNNPVAPIGMGMDLSIGGAGGFLTGSIVNVFDTGTVAYPLNEAQMTNLITTGSTSFSSSFITSSLNYVTLGRNNYVATFTGYLNIPSDGVYTFGVDSDDASDFFIEGIHLADWYGGHGANGNLPNTNSIGSATLIAGYHAYLGRLQQTSGSDKFALYYSTDLGSTWKIVPDSWFYYTQGLVTTIAGDQYNDTLVLSGSRYAFYHPSGTVTKSGSSWREVHGHNCNKLTTLDLNHNSITTADLLYNTSLQHLDVHNNSLTSLDVSTNTALITLDFSSNSLTSIDISKNVNLTDLACNTNSLTSLNISNNPSMSYLDCSRNSSITTLDISNNPLIKRSLNCSFNSLTQTAVNNILSSLVVNGQISGSVDLRNGSNAAPSSKASGSNYYTLQNARGWTVDTN